MKTLRGFTIILICFISISLCESLTINSLEIGTDLFFRINVEKQRPTFNDYTLSPFLNYYFTKYFFAGAAYEIGTVFFKKEGNFQSKNATVSSWDIHLGFTFPKIVNLFPYFYFGYGNWDYSYPKNNFDSLASLATSSWSDRVGWTVLPIALGFKYNFWNNFILSPNYKFYFSYSISEIERGIIFRHAISIELSYLIQFNNKEIK